MKTIPRNFLLLVLAGACGLVSATCHAQDQPSIAKDWVNVAAVRVSSYRGNLAIWSWKPQIWFRVNGPIASGSQLSVEFAPPGGKPVVTFDCDTEETQKGYWWNVKGCGGQNGVPDEKSLTLAGLVEFRIRLRNELHGTNLTLFTGKAKVGKYLDGSKPNHFTYYVDQDWSIPIGYFFFENRHKSDQVPHVLGAALVFRGDPNPTSGHLFYQGKEIAKDSCSDTEVESGESKFQWERRTCIFQHVFHRQAPTAGYFSDDTPVFVLAKNPGDYELKVLSKGRLARVVKFTVAADGTLDNGIAAASQLGSDRIILPVQVVGTQDGTWDRMAWKAGALYGNPLTNFTAP